MQPNHVFFQMVFYLELLQTGVGTEKEPLG